MTFAKRLQVSLLLWAIVPVSWAEPDTVRVFRVFDGDSFMARMRGQTLRFRVAGVDAPEPGQRHGPESQAILEKMLGGKRVEIETVGSETNGYLPARVTWQDYDIAEELVRAGAAWARPEGSGASKGLEALEMEAREQQRGLWAGGVPEPPWDWRARR